jgi:hypothetical protein
MGRLINTFVKIIRYLVGVGGYIITTEFLHRHNPQAKDTNKIDQSCMLNKAPAHCVPINKSSPYTKSLFSNELF